MKKVARRLLIALGSAVLVVLVLFMTALILVRRPFPRTRGTIKAAGLSAPVEVLRDGSGVPHITASAMHDLYFAQGFVHAQDRFWQMEFWRRIGSGTLSELFGKSTTGTDIYLRTLGLRRLAEEEYAAYDDETRAVLDAYAEGVNAYITARPPEKLGLEFLFMKLQGVKVAIEPWTPANTLTWLKIMSLDLGGNMSRELYAIDLLHSIGAPLSAEFFGSYRAGDMPYIVADSELPRSLLKAGDAGKVSALGHGIPLSAYAGVPTRLAGGFDPSQGLALGAGPGIGSNNWVISGARTASGKPILANDPHLGIQMPSIWYEADLSCTAQDAQPGKNSGPFHVRGFTFPGAPGVIIGHNDRIAWGVTNTGPDVQDLYMERINPENPNQYEVNGRWTDMKVRREEIKIAKEDPLVILVRETRHGPIVTDEGSYTGYRSYAFTPGLSYPANVELKALSLRWTALQRNRTIAAVVDVDKARDFQEFRDALRQWDIPSQNFVYADVDGNIGYQAPGLIPVRARANGTLPVPGWTDGYEWTGFIPFDELPWSYNPAKGYIVTANNPVTSPQYKHFIASEFDFGYRALRISQMIEGAGRKLTLEDVEAMQVDTLNISAKEIIPYLAHLSLADPRTMQAREILAAWDGRMSTDSPAAALYSHFWIALVDGIFKDQLPRAQWTPGALLENNSRQLNTVYLLLSKPNDAFWDDAMTLDVRETRDDILAAALEKAVEGGVKAQGKDMTKWRWGREHTATFRNQTLGKSGIGLVERIFNRGPFPVPAGFQQVFCTDYKVNAPFDVYSVSSMRQIVDLSDLGASLAVHTTGQSGHTGNRHYADMIDSWAKGRYHPELWERETLLKSGAEKLVLMP
jgi:penicillin amidase